MRTTTRPLAVLLAAALAVVLAGEPVRAVSSSAALAASTAHSPSTATAPEARCEQGPMPDDPDRPTRCD